MSAISTKSLEASSSTTVDQPKKTVLSDLEIKLNQLVIEEMRRMAEDTQNRMQGYMQDPSLLDKGIFYANEYYLALNATKQTAKMETLVKSDVFFHGLAPKSFKMIASKHSSGFLPMGYRLEKGIKPTQGLDEIRSGLAFLGCGEAVSIARYQALRTILGDAKFNKIFDGKSTTPFAISDNDPAKSLFLLESHSEGTPKVGDGVHFKSIQQYGMKHINGEETGYNLVCVEDGEEPKFIGHGLPPEGMTAEEVGDLLLEGFNKAPIDKAAFSQKVIQSIYSAQILKREELFKDYQLSKTDFKKYGGGSLFPAFSSFNLDRIQQLIDATANQAVTLMAKWKSQYGS